MKRSTVFAYLTYTAILAACTMCKSSDKTDSDDSGQRPPEQWYDDDDTVEDGDDVIEKAGTGGRASREETPPHSGGVAGRRAVVETAGASGASPKPGAPCAHNLCITGNPLAASCDECVAEVCHNNPSCCSTIWGESCVNYALMGGARPNSKCIGKLDCSSATRVIDSYCLEDKHCAKGQVCFRRPDASATIPGSCKLALGTSCFPNPPKPSVKPYEPQPFNSFDCASGRCDGGVCVCIPNGGLIETSTGVLSMCCSGKAQGGGGYVYRCAAGLGDPCKTSADCPFGAGVTAEGTPPAICRDGICQLLEDGAACVPGAHDACESGKCLGATDGPGYECWDGTCRANGASCAGKNGADDGEVCCSKSCNQGACCTPECGDRKCGPALNGCGGPNACGTCGVGTGCNSAGQCGCVPNCAGKQCGSDGCNGTCGPGCSVLQECQGNQCVQTMCWPFGGGPCGGDSDCCDGSCCPGSNRTCSCNQID